MLYVLKPGMVTSQTDGQHHYISAKALAHLYGVRLDQCEVCEPRDWRVPYHYRMAAERCNGLIELAPRYDGDYRIPNGDGHAPPTP